MRLPTRQDGVENRDKVYTVARGKAFWIAHLVNFGKN